MNDYESFWQAHAAATKGLTDLVEDHPLMKKTYAQLENKAKAKLAEYYDKQIDCAAIKMPDGLIWTGKRHGHCLATIIQATGKKALGATQGFVTLSGRFVTREEAFMLAKETGQVTKFCHDSQLFSEDLY